MDNYLLFRLSLRNERRKLNWWALDDEQTRSDSSAMKWWKCYVRRCRLSAKNTIQISSIQRHAINSVRIGDICDLRDAALVPERLTHIHTRTVDECVHWFIPYKTRLLRVIFDTNENLVFFANVGRSTHANGKVMLVNVNERMRMKKEDIR